MRTKRTGQGRKKAQVNGTLSKSPPTPDVKSPQPHELSEKDRARVKDFLEKSDKPFSVTTVSLNNKKRKRSGEPARHTQTDLFEDRLSVQYEIKPSNNWESLRRYKKFTVGSESIAVGECILVKHDVSDDPKIDVAAQWKAKVLEVRALDPEHVYIRVAWLNRPEDLDAGRKPYHGMNELIPTNQLDIIDAMTVNGRLELYHWVDDEDESQMPGKTEHFWRQTYDFANTKTYSELRSICIDAAAQNPDELILQCASPDCRKWMHLKCVAERAAQRANESSSGKKKASSKKKRAKSSEIVAAAPVQAAARAGSYLAEVYVQGLPDGPNDEPEAKSRIVIHNDDEGGSGEEDLRCLFCDTAIE